MSFYVEDKGNFESTPPGSHLARCYRIVDLGTQKSEYLGQVKYLHKIMLGWEIFAEKEDGTPLMMRDGRPFAIFKNYTMSWSDKATLRKDLQSWRGKPFSAEEMRRFDLKTVLGVHCMLNVIERTGQDGKTYVNVDSITPVPAMIRKAGLPDGVNKNELFNLSEPDMDMFEGFSANLKAKIQASPEWQKLHGTAPAAATPKAAAAPQASADEEDDDIPF
jgi:hypothetical protein